MKKFLAVLLTQVCLVAPAFARSPAPDEHAEVLVSCSYIRVTPIKEIDRDPVFQIIVHLQYNLDHGRYDGIYVEHYSVGGHVYNRMQQYNNVHMWDRTPSDNSLNYDILWQGYRTPYGQMTGHLLWASDDQYHYTETLVSPNGQVKMQMDSICTVLNEGN